MTTVSNWDQCKQNQVSPGWYPCTFSSDHNGASADILCTHFILSSLPLLMESCSIDGCHAKLVTAKYNLNANFKAGVCYMSGKPQNIFCGVNYHWRHFPPEAYIWSVSWQFKYWKTEDVFPHICSVDRNHNTWLTCKLSAEYSVRYGHAQ